MSNKQPIEQVASTAARATDRLAANAQSGIDATRELANDALDKASSRVTTLRDEMQPAIEAVSSRVQDMAARGMAAAAETRDLAREKLANLVRALHRIDPDVDDDRAFANVFAANESRTPYRRDQNVGFLRNAC